MGAGLRNIGTFSMDRVDHRNCPEIELPVGGLTLKKRWHIIYCDEQMDPCPVTEFIEKCHPKHQVKILRFLNLLEEKGPTLPRPYADLLRDGIHELRIKLSGDHIRMLYFFCFRKYIVLHVAFVKNANRVPEKIIDRVKRYRDRFLHQAKPETLEGMLNAAI